MHILSRIKKEGKLVPRKKVRGVRKRYQFLRRKGKTEGLLWRKREGKKRLIHLRAEKANTRRVGIGFVSGGRTMLEPLVEVRGS